MKLALIATEKLPVPAIRGGAIQIYLQSIASLLAASGHEVTVYSISDPALEDQEIRNGVRYEHLPVNGYQRHLSEALKNESYEIIHVCNRPSWIISLTDAAPKSRFVLSVHNEMFSESKLTQEEGDACIARLSKIVTVSDYIGRTIKDRFPQAEAITETVYSGVDLSAYHPVWTEEGQAIREQLRKSLQAADKKIILFVGRLSKVKGPHILLQAVPAIVAAHPEAFLLFVGSKWFGDNSVNNYVRHLYTLGSLQKENVGFIKFIRPDEIPALYTVSDLFVCSSQWQEPLARVHYEAMAAGLPIITTNRGGNGEVIVPDENGIILDNFDDPAAYAQAINRLFSDEAMRQRMGRASRKMAEEKYGWSRVAGQLLSVYEQARDKDMRGEIDGETKSI
ncbi:glycosyltransferase family 4 protein [Sporolactobacillus spathodeae]|uniref:Spore coat protein SA n=1 Tax=Sporolactobacillus spathodeae TaxID=1465502 RepID=A0ABS2Q8U9_9BACL|nr:glycosyltransferase family 4 protein [Sporolactobacillus spathodeae]MBM7658204.1 spore coat protein SA [Sporolactobacillus spathodeae]